MRLVEYADLKEDMVIGQELYGINGEMLMKTGVTLNNKLIKALSGYNIPHIYILDEYSGDIDIKCTITAAAKSLACQRIKKLYLAIQKGNQGEKELTPLMQDCLDSIDKISEDIIAEKISLYDVFDIKLVENYIYQHPVNVCIIAMIIGKTLGLNPLELYRLGVGGFFLDIGQMFIPKEILNKEGIYSDAEYVRMKQHAEDGYRFCRDEFYLPMKSYMAILQHHERYDGGGYPHKKSGEDISLYGRIVAIADVYDALSSNKTYREALNPIKAFQHIIQGAGSHFDPKLVKLFAYHVSPYPIGYTLKLPDERVGLVVENYLGKPFNPRLRIIQKKDEILTEPYHIILGEE